MKPYKHTSAPVSYTHLDVYKRQALGSTGRGPWFGREDRIKICRAAVSAKKEEDVYKRQAPIRWAW